jgi:hypothetical protein
MTYQIFRNEWNTRRDDYDGLYNYQCVDVIERYCHELGINGVYGNAIDYANHPCPAFAAHFQRVSDYQPGDVVVLYGLNGNLYGHIGLFDHQDGSGIWLLEQNMLGGGNGLGKNAIGVYRPISTSRVAAIYRYKQTAPPPPPPPVPRSTVFLPGSERSWSLYYQGSQLRPHTSDVKAVLAPYVYGGLSYKIVGWVGDYAVVVDTQMFGRGVLWVKGTSAVIK